MSESHDQDHEFTSSEHIAHPEFSDEDGLIHSETTVEHYPGPDSPVTHLDSELPMSDGSVDEVLASDGSFEWFASEHAESQPIDVEAAVEPADYESYAGSAQLDARNIQFSFDPHVVTSFVVEPLPSSAPDGLDWVDSKWLETEGVSAPPGTHGHSTLQLTDPDNPAAGAILSWLNSRDRE